MNRFVKILLIVIALAIVVFMVSDFTGNRPDRLNKNPFEYNVDEFKKVDPALISHVEVRQMKVDVDDHASISANEQGIYLASNNSVKVISIDGELLKELSIDGKSSCIYADKDEIIVGFGNFLKVYSLNGELLYQTEMVSDSSYFTGVNRIEGKMVVADAGKRVVLVYERDKLVGQFEGVSGTTSTHGFIIPSAKFDLVNCEGELWVVNPGLHSLQHYDFQGNLHDAWEKTSIQIEGFSGCCNPAHITSTNEGRLVTSEKGMPRIKIYSKKGKLESVVAPPSSFVENGQACDVTMFGDDVVALDFDKKMIRIFKRK